jgi:hypothetical protein
MRLNGASHKMIVVASHVAGVPLPEVVEIGPGYRGGKFNASVGYRMSAQSNCGSPNGCKQPGCTRGDSPMNYGFWHPTSYLSFQTGLGDTKEAALLWALDQWRTDFAKKESARKEYKAAMQRQRQDQLAWEYRVATVRAELA